jgi:xanthine dehydrogenase YagT iron-sulfur-binding subunit
MAATHFETANPLAHLKGGTVNHKDETQKDSAKRGITRRRFLTTVGTGALGVAASGQVLAATATSKQTPVVEAGELTKLTLQINGQRHTMLVEARWTLLDVLRERIGLTGTKAGCGRGECGACTVLIDDVPRYACLTLALEAENKAITTVEGLMEGERLGPVQTAFVETDAFQCGYCTSGQIMSVEGLLRRNPNPSLKEIQTAVSGNLCRCGAYPHIFDAAARAAGLRQNKRGEP